MEKIYKILNENGIFICFNEYESEEDYVSLVHFVEDRLGIKTLEVVEGPYSVLSMSNYKGNSLTIIFDDDYGCYIRVEKDQEKLADEIIEKCVH